MTIYCIDDGGDGSQTNSTQGATLDWSKADTSIDNLIAYDAAAFTTSGNVIYFGDDHVDPNKAAHYILTGPSSGLPVKLISADRTQATPTYKVGSSAQISSLGGSYNLTLDGSFALYGIKLASGSNTLLGSDDNEVSYYENIIVALGAGSNLSPAITAGRAIYKNLTIDLTADGTTNRSGVVISNGASALLLINGLSFVNAAYRTGSIISIGAYGLFCFSGADFSGFTNATDCEILTGTSFGMIQLNNCITKSSFTPFTAAANYGNCRQELYNCGPADDPTYLAINDAYGQLFSRSTITRGSGATIEGTACSWWIYTTTAVCSENSPFYTPWIYGTLSSTGSKTFTVYITNDTADFTNAEVWLEVEYLKDADEAQYFITSEQRDGSNDGVMDNILSAAVAQTDDTTSTWTDDDGGISPSFTYKQSLSAIAVIGETGQYRCRIATGVASMANTRYFFVDPKVTVS